MAPITGLTGSVTFAAGVVTNCYTWTARPSAGILDNTQWSPTDSYSANTAGLLDWEGTYTVFQRTTANTLVAAAGAAYDDNVYRLNLELTCDPQDITVFGATYRKRAAGLLRGSGSYDCWIDATTALPTPGTLDTVTFTEDTGDTYAVPLIIESADINAQADGSNRGLTINWVNSQEITETDVPLVGVTGAATFVAAVGRQLTGNILITGVRLSLSADREEGTYTFTWVGADDMTAA